MFCFRVLNSRVKCNVLLQAIVFCQWAHGIIILHCLGTCCSRLLIDVFTKVTFMVTSVVMLIFINVTLLKQWQWQCELPGDWSDWPRPGVVILSFSLSMSLSPSLVYIDWWILLTAVISSTVSRNTAVAVFVVVCSKSALDVVCSCSMSVFRRSWARGHWWWRAQSMM